eukprot:CAMPEP_0201585636 /NCGR_PEP_ID=MMETSP0190_2-20130828/124080_1 /ASSEMBLY_ACC=CAM_ASM_000263 /TAXON_ID=37353 /ORGANISM="Rosalina sp." /LENGTH=67 /DNA_ID=CAMNT_0048031977 /DNA_START=27 /DNA_END=228 /DNA_ORIENTATION=+
MTTSSTIMIGFTSTGASTTSSVDNNVLDVSACSTNDSSVAVSSPNAMVENNNAATIAFMLKEWVKGK